jgi:hypothetical protein
VKKHLRHGLDDIALTLEHVADITTFEQKHDVQIATPHRASGGRGPARTAAHAAIAPFCTYPASERPAKGACGEGVSVLGGSSCSRNLIPAGQRATGILRAAYGRTGRLELLRPGLPAAQKWRALGDLRERALYVDIETNGGMGPDRPDGAGRFRRPGRARVRGGRDLEQAADYLERRPLWMTYNGALFDVPVIRKPISRPCSTISIWTCAIRCIGWATGAA